MFFHYLHLVYIAKVLLLQYFLMNIINFERKNAVKAIIDGFKSNL